MLCGDLKGKEIFKRGDKCIHIADSLMPQMVKKLPAMQETWVRKV